jgi:predicted FMN-binding regulatory protein PaiB
MYIPEQFRMPPADVRRVVETARYGNLVTFDPDARRPVATFLPWLFAPGPDRLLTHLAKVNPQWRHTATPALVVIDLGHAAVEADWKSGYDEGRSSPGLDYEAVHLWGELTAETSLEAVLDSWDRMMVGHGSGLRVADMDQDYLAKHAAATVAVSVTIGEVEGKSKLSQAQSPADIRRIARAMAATCPALADRVLEVGLPYSLAREEAVERARRRRTGKV